MCVCGLGFQFNVDKHNMTPCSDFSCLKQNRNPFLMLTECSDRNVVTMRSVWDTFINKLVVRGRLGPRLLTLSSDGSNWAWSGLKFPAWSGFLFMRTNLLTVFHAVSQHSTDLRKGFATLFSGYHTSSELVDTLFFLTYFLWSADSVKVHLCWMEIQFIYTKTSSEAAGKKIKPDAWKQSGTFFRSWLISKQFVAAVICQKHPTFHHAGSFCFQRVWKDFSRCRLLLWEASTH